MKRNRYMVCHPNVYNGTCIIFTLYKDKYVKIKLLYIAITIVLIQEIVSKSDKLHPASLIKKNEKVLVY